MQCYNVPFSPLVSFTPRPGVLGLNALAKPNDHFGDGESQEEPEVFGVDDVKMDLPGEKGDGGVEYF